MTPRLTAIALTTVLGASIAFAHSGVENPAVKKRMDLMGEIRVAMGTLGSMAKGAKPFDATAAEAAARDLANAAGRIPALFEAKETDPKSEAAPAIWDNWDRFTAIAADMEAASQNANVSTLDDLRQSLGSIGATCGTCHKAYRIEL